MTEFAEGTYDPKRKYQKQDGSTGYANTGFIIYVGNYQGQPRITLVDQRTGERYSCFYRDPNRGSGGGYPQPAAPPQAPQYPTQQPPQPAQPPQSAPPSNWGNTPAAPQPAGPRSDEDVPF